MKGFKVVVYILFPFPKLLGAIDATSVTEGTVKLRSVDSAADQLQLAISKCEFYFGTIPLGIGALRLRGIGLLL